MSTLTPGPGPAPGSETAPAPGSDAPAAGPGPGSGSGTTGAAGTSGATAGPAPSSLRAPVTMLVGALLVLLVVGLLGRPGSSAFALTTRFDAVSLPDVVLPVQLTGIVTGAACLALGVWALLAARAGRPRHRATVPVYAALVLLAFLVWVVGGQRISFVGLLGGTMLLSVPLVLGALSGVVSERAGVVNIAIEGQLLAGAFLAAVVASVSGNAYVGLVAAPVAGALVGLLLAVFAIRYLVNQIIVGVVLNVFVAGLTSFLYATVLTQDAATYNSPPGLGRLPVPVLSSIPVIGPVLFDQNIIVYLMYAAVVVVHVALFRTRWGLRVRAVGEHPRAADTVGIDVIRTRFTNVLIAGALAGLGGAMLTLGASLAFSQEISAGKGYIALAAMIFGRYSPKGALAAALLFGFATNLQDILGGLDTPLPSELLLMAPYLATLLAVAGLVGRVRVPAASGQPYVKG